MGSPGWVRPPDPSPCCVPRRASPYPHFPGPAWLATHRPSPGLPGLSTLPHSSAQPDPWGRPSRGTPVLSLCRPLPLGSLPSRKPPPLPCRSPSLLQRVLKPLPLQASGIRQLAPSRICRALDPKAQPRPSPRKAWPSPASGLPCLDLGAGLPRISRPLIPSFLALRDPPGSCGHPLTGSRFHLSWAEGPF